jgi:Zn-finger nucleic acid-binding protein
MNCPVCREPLIVLEYDAVEIDYCVGCAGIWLDAGELELLFGDADACHAFIHYGDPAPVSRERPRRCPICRKKMAKAVARGEHPVTYDRCVRGDGLWFDKGELAEILVYGAASGHGETVSRFLREVFSSRAT